MQAASPRPLRADARRNRDRLLATALQAFSQEGAEVPLESIAKRAGVGIGTLYRHFPTREALAEAVYRAELDKLCDAAPELLGALPADQALRAWMDRFLGYRATKRGLADALRAVVSSGAAPYAHSLERLVEAIATLLDAGADQGVLRPEVDPVDVLTGISGAFLATDDPVRAGRVLDLLLEGLRGRG
ncbi:TetR/AcrR family transcriptional regulator [Saccharothrix coeruleofusca]|uniref:TetR family transcriptional regulator n=1 Tax=Saccharothrix coeruleofusca TaxID=33919 RepID=A0A918ASZ6_9PSEU|nr:TetR/AcrR family transcriptional regulator [Saccharothrix coeruleofusca]MBP2337005.1 AcrR family transcriptional regulator [Saccharothrix coeruleofusca]GGP83880.1 TetR family transcriptional regulator [Saccharothrix coeruleofusca]